MTEIQIPSEKKGEPSSGGKIWVQVLAWGFVIGLLSIVGFRMNQSGLGQVQIGAAPEFELTTFQGETIKLSDYHGKAVVINFWASWCLPCREEAPILEAAWRKYQDVGVIFIGIDYLDTESKALAYIEEFDISYPNGPDLRTQIADDYRIQGIPETFFVDGAGQLQSVFIGPISEAELHKRINELIALQ